MILRIIATIFFIQFFSGVVLASSTPKSFLTNREGANLILKGSPAGAQEKFIEGLAESPFEARLHLNLGLTFEQLGQNEKAQASYKTGLGFAKDPEEVFVANFNLGQMAQKAKQKEEALKYYQAALKVNPNSLETKVNIELLTQENQGNGKGDSQDKDKNQDQNKDKNDQSKDQKDGKDKEDQKEEDQGKEQEKKDQPKQYGKNKPQPQKFKSEDLTQGDVNKILGEIKQQEQKIRAEFNKREVKEQPKDKDW